ncbi:MAG: histidinol-phosphatase [Armatimonadota bacterium]|nr:histidinol-phosphatase [Armatimonadota bacterium]
MKTSYHVHSVYSDGENSILEIVTAASEQGLDEIGLSDHLVYPKANRSVPWSMSLDAIDSYFEELCEAQCVVGDKLRVRFGLECDYEPETADLLADVLARCPLDYVIGSVHFLDDFPIDESADYWERLDEDNRNLVARSYWQRIKELAQSRLFDIVGHLDLYKKFGWKPSIDLTEEIAEALDAIAAARMVVEVNTAGLTKPAREIYPSPEILDMCRVRDIPVIITADAHNVSGLTYGYEEARNLVQARGWLGTVLFSKRKFELLPQL